MPPKKGIGFDKTAEPCYAEKNSGKDEQRMFLNDYSAFLGDGSRNRKGQDLGEFLRGYDPHRYDTPSVTTDIIGLALVALVFAIQFASAKKAGKLSSSVE